MDKLIVVLAGYVKEINELLSTNPGLSSRFSEEIIFNNMSPLQCLEILERTVQKRSIQMPALTNPDSRIHGQMVGLIERMSTLPSWGNARDMKTLAKTIVGFVFRTGATSSNVLAISEDDVFRLAKDMLKERQDRHTNLPPKLPIRTAQKAAKQSHAPPPLPPLAESSSAQANAPPNAANESPKPATSQETDIKKDTPSEPSEPAELQQTNVKNHASASETQAPVVQRDAGVSDQIWAQLQADILAADAEPKISDQAFWSMNDVVSDTWEDAHQAELALKRLEATKAKDEADALHLKKKTEEARIEGERLRREQEKVKAEFERMRMQSIKQKREKAVQEKLRNLGVCCQGYPWFKQAEGYRCAGGSHYIGNDRLGV